MKQTDEKATNYFEIILTQNQAAFLFPLLTACAASSERNMTYSRIPITGTLANSNQHRFPVDFVHTFTVILLSVTRTLDNSNLPLTRTNFHFPSGHFVYNLTLNNSNHVFQDVTSKRIKYRRSKHWIYLKQPIASIVPVSPVQGRLHFIPISPSFAA